MSHNLKDKNRRDLNLDRSKIVELLPDYFQQEYTGTSNLQTFLEKYYDFLDSDGRHAFKREINSVITARDTSQADENFLDELISEIGNGLTVSSFFQNPRLMAKLLPLFYSSKGSKLSAEGFFRGFFGEEVDISYPKDNLLYVGGIDEDFRQGNIGFEDQLRIQNNELYQTFSILLKVGIDKSEYEFLYKKFVHPAGFFLGTQVLTQGNGIITISGQGANPLDSASALVLVDQATQIITAPAFTEMTAILDSSEAIFGHRITLNDEIDKYDDFTVNQLIKIYGTLENTVNPNSFTFDNNTRRRVFDVASDTIANFEPNRTGTDYVNDAVRLAGSIRDWNNHKGTADSNFGAYPNGFGAPSMGRMSGTSTDGFIDSDVNILVTGSIVDSTGVNESYTRRYRTLVNLTGVNGLVYWVNKGGTAWGNNPQNNEDLTLQFSSNVQTLEGATQGELLNPVVLDHVVATDETSDVWVKRFVPIFKTSNGNQTPADSNVFLEFIQTGAQTNDMKDNWAITSIFVDSGDMSFRSYDSSGPDMSLTTETMDNSMFTRYLSDSAI